MLTTACLLASSQVNDLFSSLEVLQQMWKGCFKQREYWTASCLLTPAHSDKQILIGVLVKHRSKLYFSNTALLKALQEMWNEGFLAAQILCAVWSLAPAQSDKQILIGVVMKQRTKLCFIATLPLQDSIAGNVKRIFSNSTNRLIAPAQSDKEI